MLLLWIEEFNEIYFSFDLWEIDLEFARKRDAGMFHNACYTHSCIGVFVHWISNGKSSNNLTKISSVNILH